MKHFVLPIFLSIFFHFISAQNNYWSPASYETLNLSGEQFIFPEKYATYELDYTKLKEYAFQAPLDEAENFIGNSPIQIAVPMPNGEMEFFHIVESPIYEPELVQNFPGIKTFLAFNSKHPTWYSRFDITPAGFHGMILGTDEGTVFIDPIMHLGDIQHYFSYYKKDFKREHEEMICYVDDKAPLASSNTNPSTGIHKSFGSCELRTYRLAVSATGEYTQFHGGTVAQAQAAQVTTMNRVNGVFERDMAIRMNIIGNNNLIVYTNGGSDPFTNGNTGAMINENQTNTDAVIGAANYDIGHIFGTNSGGLAQLFSPCSNNKARGVTGSGAPIGDPFDIDYVAHEMGHQFGARHTQNNNCNRSNNTAVEPGSASTIMGYAGICAPNIQNNSDDYFHGISMEEMGNFITGGSHTCPVTTPLGNIAPSVSVPNTTINIPISTPFSLTANASDPNVGNTLTYCWEQMDNDAATMPPLPTNNDGPAFRSFDPTTDSTRYFPNLPDLIAGVTPTWEVLPSVSRTMEFRVVVRDNVLGGGCNDHQDITVNVIGSAGPFIVNNPSNTGITWTGNTNETVTWDVANTNNAPVSCATVNILISYDGGVSFPDTVASNVPNDGSQSIVVPNVGTTDALVIVQCANGTFFDVSNNTFTITAITNDYTFSANNTSNIVCLGEDANYGLNIGLLGTFTGNVALSVSGLPAGLNSSFTTNNQAPIFSSTLTLSNSAAVTPGVYNFSILASGSSGTKTINASIEILPNLTGTISATSPINGAGGISSPTTLTWSSIANANYNITLSTDPGLASTLESGNALSSENYTTNVLAPNTTFYWQVEAYNPCDTITSSIFSFTTINCAIFASTDTPVAISSSGTPTVTSQLIIGGATGTINDVNVVNLTGTHSYISDLTFTLTSPNSTDVILLDQICNFQNNFDINFDDAAANNNYPCPPTDGGTYIPEQALSAFNGEDANGTWVLTLDDAFNLDGGALESWGLEICFDPPACSTSRDTVQVNGCDSAQVLSTWYFASAVINDTLIGGAASGCDSITSYIITVNNSVSSSSSITACDSAQVNGTWYFTSQAVISNDTTNAGCDSTHTTNLTINNSTSSSSALVACDSALVYGTWYFSSQALDSTFTGTNSCDSTHTVILTINNSSPITTIDLTTCSAALVGSDTTISTNGAGCDSVVITNTTLIASSTENQSIAACDSIQVAGTWYNNSTVVNDTIIGGSANGCDSIITYNILINNSVETFDTITACDSAQVDGAWYFSTQSLTFNDTTIQGCDSTHTTTLTINNSTQTISTLSACDSAQVYGTWYYSSQAINASFTGSNGCDSTHTVNLTINNSSPVTIINLSTCNASQVDSDTTTFTNAAACDSLVITNTTLIAGSTETQSIAACDSVQVAGTWYNNSTVVNDTIVGGAANGCDSIITYNILINNSVETFDTITACDSAQVNGTWYFTSQAVISNDTTSAGCDSTHTTTLTINNSTQTNSTLSACDSAQVYGTWYYSSQAINATFTGSNGCDSTHTVNLTINNSSPVTIINLSTCNASQVDSDTTTFTNAAACDSVVITNTTLIAGSTETQSIAACDSVQVAGTWYNNSAVVNDTIVGGSANGCDSIITYNILINNSVETFDTITACDSAQVNGTWYFTSQAIIVNDTTSAGCDSTHTTNLTINNSTQTNSTLSACDSAQVYGTWYYSSQAINATFTGSNGCDSTHTVNLTINNSSLVTVINLTTCNASQVDSDTTTNTNSAGCDSLVITNTTLIAGSTETQSIAACDSVQVAGTWYNNSTVVNDTIFGGAANGCDSIITYNILINNSVETFDTITACDSAQVNGTWYFTSQAIIANDTTSEGCDSTHTTTLTINNSTQTNSTLSACDSAQVYGTWYYSSQAINASFTGSNGCDSTHTVNLTINNSSPVTVINLTTCNASQVDSDTTTNTNAAGCDSLVITNTTLVAGSTETQSIAACDSIQVAGIWYNNSTVVNDTIIGGAANGCDSIITYNILINNSVETFDTITACDSAQVNGTWYFSTQSLTFNDTTIEGCDSTHTTQLNINQSSTSLDVQTSCDSLTWIDGNTYFSSNSSATFTLSNSVGCDSVVSLDLTILPNINSVDSIVNCGPYTWIDGNTYNTSNNSATFSIPTGNGCDSIITLNLTVNNPSSSDDIITACDSLTWINGITYYSSTNSPSVTLTNTAGCDSVVTLDLTVFYTNLTTDNQTACDSLTWIDGNTYFTSTSTPTITLTNSFGCDSIVSLNLTVNNSSSGIDVVNACDSITWLDGNTYSSSNNTATFLTTNNAGCDSLITLNFNLLPQSSGIDSIVSCGPYTWIDGITYNNSNNSATFTLPGSNGCDSLVTLNLTVNNATTSTDVITACGSYTWIDGNTYTTSNNTASVQLLNSAGCDSIVNLDLSISNLSVGTDIQFACDQFTWIDGNTYTSSNNTASLTFTGGAANGCDSVVILDLTLEASQGSAYVITECDSYTWINGVTYTSSIFNETFVVPGAATNGCDSVYFLDLTILPSGSGTDLITACGSYTWIDGITYTSDNNTATFLVPGGSQNGCDALMTLDLTIETIPSISISSANGVLTATPGLGNYQWYRNNVVIPGATNQSYTPTSFGLHTCSTNNGQCEGFSNGILISITGLKDAAFDYVGIYPNPVNDFMRIDVANETLESIRLIDVAGKVISNLDAKQREFYMGDYARGIYYIQLSNKSKQSMVKIILD